MEHRNNASLVMFAKKLSRKLRLSKKEYWIPSLRHEFNHLQFSSYAIQKVLDDYDFVTVLDIGCGSGEHADVFLQYGKRITAIDYGKSVYFSKKANKIDTIVADFNRYNFNQSFDCVWCSHVLEHQLNVNNFLKKIFSLLKENGVLVITVPPYKSQIVGGHICFWNAGLLLYNLILAGFNCVDASILKYGYNITVVVSKKTVCLPIDLSFDKGDVFKLKEFFPEALRYKVEEAGDFFDGNISRLNW